LQFFAAEAVPGYDYRYGCISDLGAVGCADICSPRHALMNASFVLQSGLILTGFSLAPRARVAARSGIAAGAVGLAACGALGLNACGGVGVGAVERLAAYLFVLWLAVNGASGLRGDGGAHALRAKDPRA
jgi:hypothetical membrane protein